MGLNPNGIPNPQMTPQPGMGIMAMMAASQPAALGGFPSPVPGGDQTSTAVPVPLSSNLPLTTAPTLLSPLNGDKAGSNGFETRNRRESSSPSVSLINVAKVSPQLSRPVTTPLLAASASEHQCWRTTVITTLRLSLLSFWNSFVKKCVRGFWGCCVIVKLKILVHEAWVAEGIYEIHYYSKILKNKKVIKENGEWRSLFVLKHENVKKMLKCKSRVHKCML